MLGQRDDIEELQKFKDQYNGDKETAEKQRAEDKEETRANAENTNKIEDFINSGLRSLEKRTTERLEGQFKEFLMRIDGELIRRNRMRLENKERFQNLDNYCDQVKKDITRFEKNQQNMLGTIRKLIYATDIQSSINIQDELDREWVSLFAGIDERTGYPKSSIKNCE